SASGRLLVVYNQAAKKPDDPAGNIAAPVAVLQRAGSSNNGGNVALGQPVVRTSTADAAGDALSRWTTSDSVLGSPGVPQPSPEVPALDLLDVRVGPELDLETGQPVADGGFTVEMQYADLSAGALTQALQAGPGTSLVYLFRFFDGFQPGGATAHYEPATGGWRFGYDDYRTTAEQGRNPQGNVQVYKGGTPIPGEVDQEAGIIRLSVPRELVEALAGGQGPGERPTQQTAVQGDRVYDASAWTFINPLPNSQLVQSFLFQADNTAAFDFLLGAGSTGGTGGTGDTDGTGGGTGQGGSGAAGTDRGRLPATGGLPVLAAAVLLAAAGTAALARRRASR
ncbi:MAG: hypothetical protein ACLGI3_08510, partial [Actinomycetes bacterium]